MDVDLSHTLLIFFPKLKHKVDIYVRSVSIINVVLFTKNSYQSQCPM